METQFITSEKTILEWYKAGKADDFPVDAGIAVKYNDKQIAVFQFGDTGEWYATQNMCPHKLEMALARGIIGSEGEEPKVACPFHKKTFSLKTGGCLSGDDLQIKTYPVKIDKGYVYIGITED
nr:nitrite reductase small subunit NirD [uncultured Carboxylicivirga sp.]